MQAILHSAWHMRNAYPPYTSCNAGAHQQRLIVAYEQVDESNELSQKNQAPDAESPARRCCNGGVLAADLHTQMLSSARRERRA